MDMQPKFLIRLATHIRCLLLVVVFCCLSVSFSAPVSSSSFGSGVEISGSYARSIVFAPVERQDILTTTPVIENQDNFSIIRDTTLMSNLNVSQTNFNNMEERISETVYTDLPKTSIKSSQHELLSTFLPITKNSDKTFTYDEFTTEIFSKESFTVTLQPEISTENLTMQTFKSDKHNPTPLLENDLHATNKRIENLSLHENLQNQIFVLNTDIIKHNTENTNSTTPVPDEPIKTTTDFINSQEVKGSTVAETVATTLEWITLDSNLENDSRSSLLTTTEEPTITTNIAEKNISVTQLSTFINSQKANGSTFAETEDTTLERITVDSNLENDSRSSLLTTTEESTITTNIAEINTTVISSTQSGIRRVQIRPESHTETLNFTQELVSNNGVQSTLKISVKPVTL